MEFLFFSFESKIPLRNNAGKRGACANKQDSKKTNNNRLLSFSLPLNHRLGFFVPEVPLCEYHQLP